MTRTLRLTPRQMAILAAGFTLATQGLGLSAAPPAQAPAGKTKPQSPAFKYGEVHQAQGQLTVAGLLNGSPVFRNARGECFRVEAGTGDLKFLDPASLGQAKAGATQRPRRSWGSSSSGTSPAPEAA